MEIKVIRKKEVLPESSSNCVTLLFKKTHLRTNYTKVPIVTMYDEKVIKEIKVLESVK